MRIYEVINQTALDVTDDELDADLDVELVDGDQPIDDDSIESDMDDELLDGEIEDEVNPDMQGLIRSVPGARLVYKREEQDGTYSEMWVYSAADIKKTTGIRKGILSATDIQPGQRVSQDRTQRYETWDSGSIEIMVIKGLPN